MRVVFWNLAFASWLLVSAFAFTRSPISLALVAVAAVAVAVLSTVSAGKPASRYLIALVALAVAALALLLPETSAAARISDALTAALLFALSVVSPVHASGEAPHPAA
jgi:hypothetical protein